MAIRKRRPSRNTTFSSHHNDTVCSLGPVQCRCRRILQYIDTLNVLGVDSGYRVTNDINVVRVVQIRRIHIHRVIQHNAIQHPQRLAVTNKSRSTAHTDTGGSTDFTGIGHQYQTGDTSFQSLVYGCHTGDQNILCPYRRNRTRQMPPVNGLVTGLNHIRCIQFYRILLHHHLQVLAFINNRLRFHADKTEHQFDLRKIAGAKNFKVTVCIR